MSDESVHEIQLNGKQLVFMFMTATVAAVVIFLCGVMVGRGVNTARVERVVASAAEATVDPTSTVPPESAPAAEAPASEARVSTQDDLKDLSYAGRLEAPEAPPEPAVEPVSAPVPAIVESKPERPVVVPTKAAQTEAVSREPKGDGFVVQVAAVRSRDEADAISRRLSSKGFPSFVSASGASAARVFRVRVGRYNDRGEAETVARRLEKEEQFKPWITR